MVRNDIKNSSLLKTKFLIYAFNGRTKKYAEELIRIEFEGQINQIKVASEIEYRYPKNEGGGANKLIDRYSADKTIKLRKEMVPSQELKQFYIKQGGALRNEARRNQRHKL